jgi:hypothetical protein
MIATFLTKIADEEVVISIIKKHSLSWTKKPRHGTWTSFKVTGTQNKLFKLCYHLGQVELNGFLFE